MTLTTGLGRRTRRFAVIDHHAVIRDRFVARLQREDDIEVVATGGTVDMAIQLCERDRPDVLLLDPALPDVVIPDLISVLRMLSPDTRIIVITDTPQHPSVTAALAAGADGMLVKTLDRGRKPPTSHMPCGDDVPEGLGIAAVTPREREVARLVSAGHTNNEIGSLLGLSNNTVKSYLRNAMQKLQARNRAQLVTNARTLGLL